MNMRQFFLGKPRSYQDLPTHDEGTLNKRTALVEMPQTESSPSVALPLLRFVLLFSFVVSVFCNMLFLLKLSGIENLDLICGKHTEQFGNLTRASAKI